MPREMRKVPWLKKRGGVFYANWYEPASEKATGRTRTLSLRTASDSEAAVRFAAFLVRGATYFSTDPAFRGVSVLECLDAYELDHVNLHVTDKTRQIIAISHLKKHFSGMSLKDIDIPASRGYAECRRLAHISDSTIRRELGVLYAAARHALKWRKIAHADMPSMELPREPRPDEALWLTKSEVDAVYNVAEGAVKDFIALAYFTASRRAAIEDLKAEQVDLDRARINLHAAGSPDTKKRRPIVPIHPKIMPICRKLVTGAENGFLFGPPRDFYTPFRMTCHKAGIDDRRSHPHVLRHSRATHLLMDGVSIFNVAKLLGDTIQTVSRVYGHSCPDHLASAIGDG
jgi:integrase